MKNNEFQVELCDKQQWILTVTHWGTSDMLVILDRFYIKWHVL